MYKRRNNGITEGRKITIQKSNSITQILLWLFVTWIAFGLTDLLMLSTYKISSNSMEPTIITGKRVFVNKSLMGARIGFGHIGKSNHMGFYRLKGIRDVNPNDIICFNFPHKNENLTAMGLGDEIYCKRVLGCPGDRIGAVDGHCWNDKVLRPIGVVEEQEKLRWMFDGFFKITNSFEVLPHAKNNWNLKNWGPIIVPAKGMTIDCNDNTRELYRQVIEYETGVTLEDSVEEYTFHNDYYFAVGDNAMSSFDSRYWGFIPEDFIIGIVGGKRFRNK